MLSPRGCEETMQIKLYWDFIFIHYFSLRVDAMRGAGDRLGSTKTYNKYLDEMLSKFDNSQIEKLITILD